MSQLQCQQLNKLSLAFSKFNIFISHCELKLNMPDIYCCQMEMKLKCHFSWNGIQKFFAKTNKSDGDFTEICKLICKECDFDFKRCEISASLSEILEANIDIAVKNNKLEFIDSYSDYACDSISAVVSSTTGANIDYSTASNIASSYNISYDYLNNLDVTSYSDLANAASSASSITGVNLPGYYHPANNDPYKGPVEEKNNDYVWDGSSLTEKDKKLNSYYEKYIKNKYKPTDNKWAKWQEENIPKAEEPVPKIEPKEEPKDRFDLLDLD